MGSTIFTGSPSTGAYGSAGAGCACSRCGMGGLFFILFFSSCLSYFPFLMPHLLDSEMHRLMTKPTKFWFGMFSVLRPLNTF